VPGDSAALPVVVYSAPEDLKQKKKKKPRTVTQELVPSTTELFG
jgi:hypothetical protein